MDPEDSDEPSSAAARDSGNSSSDKNSGDEPSYSAARDSSTDNESDLNLVGSTGSAPSSDWVKSSDDRTSNVPAGEPSSSIAKDASDTSSDANNVAASSRDKPSSSNANAVASTREEPSSSASRGSSSSSGRSVDVASGYTCDELIFKALYTITDNHDGTGRDINGIFEYHRGMPGLPDNFMDLLKDELKKLVAEGELEQVGNIYKIPRRSIPPEAANPTESVDTEGSEKPQESSDTPQEDSDMPQESSDTPQGDSDMPQELPAEDTAMPQEVPRDENQQKIDEALRLVAVAEDCERQAKEAVEQANRSFELLHESRTTNLLAIEVARRCARGEKVFMR